MLPVRCLSLSVVVLACTEFPGSLGVLPASHPLAYRLMRTPVLADARHSRLPGTRSPCSPPSAGYARPPIQLDQALLLSTYNPAITPARDALAQHSHWLPPLTPKTMHAIAKPAF
ncbi:hypothetical protein FRC08_007025 [Ceratobasidium sp. 394]|nr:hypothetical protein FRC08_007025 [Ceratobasidium sp. 394]